MISLDQIPKTGYSMSIAELETADPTWGLRVMTIPVGRCYLVSRMQGRWIWFPTLSTGILARLILY